MDLKNTPVLLISVAGVARLNYGPVFRSQLLWANVMLMIFYFSDWFL